MVWKKGCRKWLQQIYSKRKRKRRRKKRARSNEREKWRNRRHKKRLKQQRGERNIPCRKRSWNRTDRRKRHGKRTDICRRKPVQEKLLTPH